MTNASTSVGSSVIWQVTRVLALPECWYWIRKLQARFFAGDYPAAIEASLNAERLLWTSPAFFEVAEYHFYSALSRAASCDSATDDSRQRHFEALAAHQKQHEIWAQHCPENFENRAALVGAEIARIEGRVLEAEQLYEQAIRSAHSNGFVNNEAIAYELAARFYAARGFQKFADAYLLRSPVLLSALGGRWQSSAAGPLISSSQKGIVELDADEHNLGVYRTPGSGHGDQSLAGSLRRDGFGKTDRQPHCAQRSSKLALNEVS